MPWYFIATFQHHARVFHCDFSNVGQGIFKYIPGYFIAIFKCRPGYFQMYPRVFHYHFSNACLGISLQLFKTMPEYFIVTFQM
jgi:hypothetical protein